MPPDYTRDKVEVKSIHTTFNIIEALRELEGAGITELANELGIAKSTVSRHTSSLEKLEYIVKEDSMYYPGLHFLRLGEYARERKEAYSVIQPKVREIANSTTERSNFLIEEHGEAVYMFAETGDHAIKTIAGPGIRVPIHATAAGKAILAANPNHRVEEIIDRRGFTELTDNTITDRGALLEEIEKIRDSGYSTNNQESIEGVRAVGVSIRGTDKRVIGALSVAGPTNRIKGDLYKSELPDLLLGEANEIELNIAYPK